MSIKTDPDLIGTDDEYREIAFMNRTDDCPNCGRKKVKRNAMCSECNKKANFKKKKIIGKYEDVNSYCQNAECPKRWRTMQRKDMKKYKNFVFCSNLCVKEFKEVNL